MYPRLSLENRGVVITIKYEIYSMKSPKNINFLPLFSMFANKLILIGNFSFLVT